MEDNGTTTTGDGSSKATIKYSCRVIRNLGGWATYSVKVSNTDGEKLIMTKFLCMDDIVPQDHIK